MRTSERFTDKGIAALKPKSKRYELVEPRTGLALRVNTSGVKSFSYLFWFNGGPRRATLGAYRSGEDGGASTAPLMRTDAGCPTCRSRMPKSGWPNAGSSSRPVLTPQHSKSPRMIWSARPAPCWSWRRSSLPNIARQRSVRGSAH